MNRKSRNIAKGKIIDLCKQINLKKPEEFLFHSQFLNPQNRSPVGIAIDFWAKEKSQVILLEISEIFKSESEFKGFEREELKDFVLSTLRQLVFDSNFFDGNKIYFSHIETLFEARLDSNAGDFSEKVLEYVLRKLKESCSNWIFLLPIINLRSGSHSLQGEKISLIDPSDDSFWDKLKLKYPIDPKWNPLVGGLSGGPNLSFFLKKFDFTWISIEVKGFSFESAKKKSEKTIREFVSVLISSNFVLNKQFLAFGQFESPNMIFSFSEKSAINPGMQLSQLESSMPSIISLIEVNQQLLSKVSDWYERKNNQCEVFKERTFAASQFLFFALTPNKLNSFLHFFISLDALFGERNSVEKNITEGILRLNPNDSKIFFKASRLFDLRSEIVHGSCSDIEHWNEIYNYQNFTKSHPYNDLVVLSLCAFQEFPDNGHLQGVFEKKKDPSRILNKVFMKFLGWAKAVYKWASGR